MNTLYPMEPLQRARLSLDGLSVGDAFGEKFFVNPAVVDRLIAERAVPRAPWHWTDDTAMAVGLFRVLEQHQTIDQDALAKEFARNFGRQPDRGYGPGARKILTLIGQGLAWRGVAHEAFGGKGSLGNGSAMRVAPLGAFFCDQPEPVILEQAALSAEVTHTHDEGKAGAIAVALAAAFAARPGAATKKPTDFLQYVLVHTPESEVKNGIQKALELSFWSYPPRVEDAVGILGNGKDVTCMDTVPFCLWAASRHLGDYREALWTTVSALGDRDTTCAIVGGIVALSAGRAAIPVDWLTSREPLP
jgi:ADP-ribosylglycohydrolase